MIAVEDALLQARAMLNADGYDLRVDSFADGQLALSVVAGPEACEECLVPKQLLTGIVKGSLPEDFPVSTVSLRYPTDAD